MPHNKQKLNYSEEQMIKAIAAVKRRDTIRGVAKSYNVPRATLFDKVKGKTPIGRRMGRDPYLRADEDQSVFGAQYSTDFSKKLRKSTKIFSHF